MSDTSPQFVAPRHPPGRGSMVRHDERKAIQLAHLVEGLNQSELARRFGRSRETIGGVLKGEAFETTKKEVQQGITDEARLILHRHMVPAAVAWGRTLGIASEKGDHRPAKDLLLHTKAIEPPKADQTNEPKIVVHIGSPHIDVKALLQTGLASSDTAAP